MSHEELVARAMSELQTKTAAHDAVWQIGSCSWQADINAGTLIFQSPNGMAVACDLQMVGTYDTTDGTFLWAWDHPSVPQHLSAHAALVRDYGEKANIESLRQQPARVTEQECWEFAALACHFADAQGAYRGPAGSTMVFFTFGEPRISRRDQPRGIIGRIAGLFRRGR